MYTKIVLTLILVTQLLLVGLFFHGFYIYTCPCDEEFEEETFTAT